MNDSIRLVNSKCYIRVSSPLLEGWEECNDMKLLQTYITEEAPEHSEGIRWKGGRIPADELKRVLGTIRQFPHTETGYILYYSLGSGAWKIECAQQTGTGTSLHMQGEPVVDGGYVEIGTIHTHPEMSAFWSGTDLADQRGRFGVHIVFGLRKGLVAQTLCTIFTPNGSHDIELSDIAEEVPLDQEYPGDPVWVDKIQKCHDRALEERKNRHAVSTAAVVPAHRHLLTTAADFRTGTAVPVYDDSVQSLPAYDYDPYRDPLYTLFRAALNLNDDALVAASEAISDTYDDDAARLIIPDMLTEDEIRSNLKLTLAEAFAELPLDELAGILESELKQCVDACSEAPVQDLPQKEDKDA